MSMYIISIIAIMISDINKDGFKWRVPSYLHVFGEPHVSLLVVLDPVQGERPTNKICTVSIYFYPSYIHT